MNNLQISYIPVSDLKPYENNARKHEDKDIDAIVASIREFGFDDPVGMIAEILRDFTEDEDTVLDCFGGSGSTLIACEQMNRRCFMCELDPHYVDVIIDRWGKFTGEKAVLLNDES